MASPHGSRQSGAAGWRRGVGLESALLAGNHQGPCRGAVRIQRWGGGWPSTSRPRTHPGGARHVRVPCSSSQHPGWTRDPPGLWWMREVRAPRGPSAVSKDKLPSEIPGSESTLANHQRDSDFLFLREEHIITACSHFQALAQTRSRNATYTPK